MELLPEELLMEIGAFLTGQRRGEESDRAYCLLADAGRPLRLTCKLFRSVLARTLPLAFYRCTTVSEMLGIKPLVYDREDPLTSPLLECAPFAHFHSWSVHPSRTCVCHGHASSIPQPLQKKWSMHKVDMMMDAWKQFHQQASARSLGKPNIVLAMPSFQFLSEWTQFVNDCGISLWGLRAFMVRKHGSVEVHWIPCEKEDVFSLF